MDISRDIDSLSNFKRNTPKFLEQMKETKEPVVLTINGKAELVVQDAQAYQSLLDRIEYLETVKAISQGLQDVEEGKTVALEEFEARMRQKHGIRG
ncbi:type II toxin-antitoxin system Phd/YefM family antitoxin [Scytonema sp. UIC 10036]|uniref:type II toxin-antitoxin system Phd/YefM family antitoxin n=1 Tax=Scytonema sp. UIC 10036 TaxID=2304196 RepID=UPI0012DA17DF|nr:type II toxin-antitoxin system Phd/YefM family antitoxin [Scytonema sp. UIC 10036]MUG96995.1 type II toxin-antitoxin system Phd/YefM family antitoxin [Scytonema sp. UIC 10036]